MCQCLDAGHFGYIEHVSSKKIVHPRGGNLAPGDDTKVVYHSDRHAGAPFGFDEENERIMLKGGKIWHSRGGAPNPGDDTKVVLHGDVHDAARFYFVDAAMNRVSPYPTPNLSGDWKIVHAVLNPKATHTYTYKTKKGKSITSSKTENHAWSISAGVAKDLFSASAEYSGYVERTDSETWTDEIEVMNEITVTPGKSVVTWQYTFGIEQYGEGFQFQSNILADTESEDVVPKLLNVEK